MSDSDPKKPFEIDQRRMALVKVVSRYLENREKFFEDWEDSCKRRAMFEEAAGKAGWHGDTLARLVAEDMTGLAGLGAILAVHATQDVSEQQHKRYGGNKLYIESVTPSTLKAGVPTQLTVSVIIDDADPVVRVRPSAGGDWTPLTEVTTERVTPRRIVYGTVTFPTPGAWILRAAVPSEGEEENRAEMYPLSVTA